MGCASSRRVPWEEEVDGVQLRLTSYSSCYSQETVRYLETGAVGADLVSALAQLLKAQPRHPAAFLFDVLAESDDPAQGVSRDSIARVDLLQSMPAYALTSNTAHFLDCGSVEMGFYDYRFQQREEVPGDQELVVRGSKLQKPFFSNYVDAWAVNPLVDLLVEKFQLEDKAGWQDFSIVAGAVDTHRLLLNNSQQAYQSTQAFFQEVETTLSTKLGGRPVKLQLFLLSGLTVAKLEMHAVQYLVSRSSLLSFASAEMKEQMLRMVYSRFQEKDKHSTFASFQASMKSNSLIQGAVESMLLSGIISAGGNASHLVMTSGSISSSVQLFHMPLGNQVALSGFSHEVTLDERARWSARLKMEMVNAEFPQDVRGFFIGIAAAFYAAKEAGLADRVITQPEALAALSQRLQKLGPTEHRSLANVTLLYEFLKFSFHHSAFFLFKRNWCLDNSQNVLTATWTLGAFIQQHGLRATQRHLGIRRSRRAAARRLVPPLGMADARTVLFEVPFIAWPIDTSLLLDLGSGEIGVYVFEPTLKQDEIPKVTNDSKIPEPLYDGFVATGRLADFIEKVTSEFKLDVAKRTRPWVITAGLTGLHREMLSKDTEKRNALLQFLEVAEKALHDRLGVPVKMRIFVPSAELEAQCELRGVEWLFGKSTSELEKWSQPSWMLGMAFNYLAEVVGQKGNERVYAELGLEKELWEKMTALIHEGHAIRSTASSKEPSPLSGKEPNHHKAGLGHVALWQSSGHKPGGAGAGGTAGGGAVEAEPAQQKLNSAVPAAAAKEQDRSGKTKEMQEFAPIKESDSRTALRPARTKDVLDPGGPKPEEGLDSRGSPGSSPRRFHMELFTAAAEEYQSVRSMVWRTSFRGTISCGGGSSQLALAGVGGQHKTAQLFSIPVGNRVPMTRGLFSNPVTWEQRQQWEELIRANLGNFPKGVQGLFVGISAMYHAAKSAGIADRVVPKVEARRAFASALANTEPTEQRAIANLTLVKEIIDWVFDDNRACFLFKRNWTTKGGKYVAGWALGLYVMQFEGDRDVVGRAARVIQRMWRKPKHQKMVEAVRESQDLQLFRL